MLVMRLRLISKVLQACDLAETLFLLNHKPVLKANSDYK
jgi:hypothetical protein